VQWIRPPSVEVKDPICASTRKWYRMEQNKSHFPKFRCILSRKLHLARWNQYRFHVQILLLNHIVRKDLHSYFQLSSIFVSIPIFKLVAFWLPLLQHTGSKKGPTKASTISKVKHQDTELSVMEYPLWNYEERFRYLQDNLDWRWAIWDIVNWVVPTSIYQYHEDGISQLYYSTL
jgi:hypothetical protein